jgi:Trypsin
VLEFCDFPCGNKNNCAGTCVSGTLTRNPQYSGDGDFDHDVAVMQLSQDFTTITGISPDRLGSPAPEGDVVTVVGYGCTTWDDTSQGVGQKRAGINNVDTVHDELIDVEDESQSYICPGDSGGPMYKWGTDCEVGVNVGKWEVPLLDRDYEASRVDTKFNWIRNTAGDLSVNACGQTTCGDGLCRSPESCGSCPADCGACGVCGDAVCGPGESCQGCPGDCGTCPPVCGDGACNGNEDPSSCLQDCPVHCPSGQVDCCNDGNCLPRTTCQHVLCGD